MSLSEGEKVNPGHEDPHEDKIEQDDNQSIKTAMPPVATVPPSPPTRVDIMGAAMDVVSRRFTSTFDDSAHGQIRSIYIGGIKPTASPLIWTALISVDAGLSRKSTLITPPLVATPPDQPHWINVAWSGKRWFIGDYAFDILSTPFFGEDPARKHRGGMEIPEIPKIPTPAIPWLVPGFGLYMGLSPLIQAPLTDILPGLKTEGSWRKHYAALRVVPASQAR